MSISGYVTKGIDVIVGIIVLFLLYANLVPEAQAAGVMRWETNCIPHTI